MAFSNDFGSAFRRLRGRLPVYAGMLHRFDWLAMFILGRFEIVQKWAGREKKGDLSQPQATAAQRSVILSEMTPEEIVRHIGVNGIAEGLRLPEETVADVISFAARTPCYANAERDRPLDRCQRGQLAAADAVIGDYLDSIADCDAIRRLWRDPKILAIAGGYLGRKPLPLRSRLWWSFRNDRATSEVRAAHAQDLFHFDLDDWRAIKFFFYLTDVGRENGPHIYVRKSHRNRSIRDQLLPFKGRSSRYIAARYGEANFAIIQGPAGTGFVQDPYGFHTGTSVMGASRLIFEIEYGVSRPTLAGPFYVPR